MVPESAIKGDDTQEAPKVCQSESGWTAFGGRIKSTMEILDGFG